MLFLWCLVLPAFALADDVVQEEISQQKDTTETDLVILESAQEEFIGPVLEEEPQAVNEEQSSEEKLLGADGGEFQAMSGEGGETGEGGVNISPSLLTDPFARLKGFDGNFNADLFTGSASFSYPIQVPPGRNGIQPSVSLSYSNTDKNFNSVTGYGWSLPTNAIFRSTGKGVDRLYTEDDYSASMFGSFEELIVTDSANDVYTPKQEGSFTKYEYDDASDSWTATDTQGTKYYFGSSLASKHTDPNDTSRVYKWLLNKAEDTNGNFMTFTYTKDSGQVYPESIRYTGNGADPGDYEIEFVKEYVGLAPVTYVSGFKLETNYRITDINIYSYRPGSKQLVMSYEMDYADADTVFHKIESITINNGSESLPPTTFSYYDGTESYAPGSLITKPHLLKTITGMYGGITELTYRPSTAYRTEAQGPLNTSLPFIVNTIHTITNTDPVSGLTATTTYEYGGGHYYFDQQDVFKREYAGFAKVSITDPEGNMTSTYFHQSEFAQDNSMSSGLGEYDDHISKKGKIWRQETYNNQDGLQSVSITTWDKAQLPDQDSENDRFFPYASKTVSITFDGQQTGRASASESTYNTSNGNLTQQIDLGEVSLNDDDVDANGDYDGDGSFTDTGTDKITTTIEYAENTSKHILSLPSRTESKDQNDEIIGERKTYYDNLALGQVNKGNATKSETRATNSPLKYITTETVYNSYGLPTDIINARGYPTYITYDSNNLYPQYITNAKTQTTTYAYHPLFGVPEQVTGPNGMVSKTVFDGLGRVTEAKVSNPDNPSQLITTSVTSYDFSSSPVSITATAYANNTDVNSNPIEITSKTYLDGFGRTIQTKSEAEGSNVYTTSSTIYDERGNVQKELFPQFKSGLSFSNINSNDPGVTYEYDALGRVTSATVPYGSSDTATTTTSYDRWSQTVTNPNGVPKEFFYDSRGNLLQVTEHNGANEYDTLYTYNPNNNLTQITDSQGNTKDFSYDLLGRKLYENDFHSDSTFSEWQYAYDENGNLIWMKDSKNQETNFTYDQLDRILTEQSAQTTSTYSYDSAPNGIGRLTSVTSPNITKSYEYDILGNIAKETRTISSTDYVTQYEYDLLGNPKQITYPDSENTLVTYGFNNAGQTSTVDTASDSITTNIDYNPIGLPTVIDYANGVTTTNTYDINQNYKLVSKLTTDSSSTELQNISYTFDKVGNITNKDTDDSTQLSGNTSYTYDDLDRLLTATTTNAASGDNYTRTYSYDSIGNITSKLSVDSGQSPEDIDYTYSESNYASPHAVTQAGDQNFTYDNNGNLQTDGNWTHSWDYKDRLISSSTSGTTVSYEYDESKTRVIKHNESTGKITTYINDLFDIEDGEEKIYFFSGDLKLATLDSSSSAPTGDPDECDVPTSGNWTVNSDCTIATFETAPADVTITAGTILTIASSGILEVDLNTNSLTVENGGGILIENGGSLAQSGLLPPPSQGGGQGEISLVFHHSDHLSGASVDTDESGSVVALNDYYPFGDTRIESGEYENDYTYTGKERDEDTELLYYEARYYNSNIGRFISIDPWSGDITDPQSLNKYAYVRNNPLKYVDPEGESFGEVIDWTVRTIVAPQNANAPAPDDETVPSPSIIEASAQNVLVVKEIPKVGGMLIKEGWKKLIQKTQNLKQSNQSLATQKQIGRLEKGIRKHERRIEEHQQKIKDLINGNYKIDPNKTKGDPAEYKSGLIKQWSNTIQKHKNEINKKQEQIKELKNNQVQNNTGGGSKTEND
jgi:RHS repeat-associated protein